MTDHQDHDTEAAPTAAAELADETTELPPATHAGPELAWSAADDDEDRPAEHKPWPRVLVLTLIALVGLIALAVIGLGATYFQQITAKPVEHQPINWPTCTPQIQGVQTCVPAPPTVTALAPLPSAVPEPPPAQTVTVTAEPPPAPSAVAPTTAPLSDTDDAFLTQMKSTGMSIPTLDAAEYAVSNAHQVCAYRATHDEGTTQKYAASVTAWADGASASAFTDQAEFHYCTQYLPAGY
jgi:hypothetical protein